MSGELVSPPRLKNPSIPKVLSDIVMQAMAPEVGLLPASYFARVYVSARMGRAVVWEK